MSRPSREQSGRKERIPVSASRAPLSVRGADHENYYYRFVNDVNDRIARFIDGGYVFVTKDGVEVGEPTVDTSPGLDTRVKRPVGQGVYAYLMRLPRELWNEDQKAKQRELDLIDDAIKRPQGAEYGRVSISNKRGSDLNPEYTKFDRKE